MNIIINNQLKKYIDSSGKVVLNACPGSGKTTAIALKLIDLSKKEEYFFKRHSGIACLSFTNTAKEEIGDCFYKLSGNIIRYPNLVSTIDSFINQYITLPFYYLICNGIRPKILEKDIVLDDILENKLNQYRCTNQKPLYYIYKPSSIKIEKNNSFSINGHIPSAEKVKEETFNQYCKSIKSWQKNTGLLTNDDSAFFALHLLKKYPRIGEYLAKRFNHIIIDEAQDTSEIQYAIFDKLIEVGLKNIEFIGDPYQSLYEWREATPILFLEKYNSWNGLELTNNRRSSQQIIDTFSLIRNKKDYSITTDNILVGLPINIYKYNVNFDSIISHYENECKKNKFENNHIVVRGNGLKSKIMGTDIEYKPWKSITPYQIINARIDLFKGNVKNAIKVIRKLYISLLYNNIDHRTQRDLEDEISINIQLNSLFINILTNLPSFDLSVEKWTQNTQLFIKKQFSLNTNLDFEIRNRNSSNFNKDTLNETINSCFNKETRNFVTPLTTIHQVKGKTLDSILIIFNEKSHKENITFYDIISSENEFPSEKQRMIYVAMSRPRYLLSLAFPNNILNEEIKLKFGSEIKIIENI